MSLEFKVKAATARSIGQEKVCLEVLMSRVMEVYTMSVTFCPGKEAKFWLSMVTEASPLCAIATNWNPLIGRFMTNLTKSSSSFSWYISCTSPTPKSGKWRCSIVWNNWLSSKQTHSHRLWSLPHRHQPYCLREFQGYPYSRQKRKWLLAPCCVRC